MTQKNGLRRFLNTHPKLEHLVFVGTRILGLTLRPAILLFAGNISGDFAVNFALTVTVLASTLILFTNNSHIDAYRTIFSADPKVTKSQKTHAWVGYLNSQLIHMCLLGPLVFGACYLWTQDIYLALLVFVLLINDKFFDEENRYNIFKRDFIQWSIGFAFRLLFPALVTLILVLGYSVGSVPIFVATTVFFGLLYVAIYLRAPVERHIKRAYRSIKWRSHIQNMVRVYVGHFFRNYMFLQLWSFLCANIIIIDRIAIRSLADLASLPNYTLAFMIANLVPTLHRALYVERRRSLIMQDPNVWNELGRWKNWVLPAAIAAFLGICLGVDQVLTQLLTRDVVVLIFKLMLGMYLFAAAMIVLEASFWHVPAKILVPLDGILIIAAFSALWAVGHVENYPFVMAAMLGLRLGLLTFLTLRYRPA